MKKIRRNKPDLVDLSQTQDTDFSANVLSGPLVFDARINIHANYEFQPIILDGDLVDVLSGNLAPEDFVGGKAGRVLLAMINQFRAQTVEWKTSIALTEENDFLIQTRPNRGTRDLVDNIFVHPPSGAKVMEIHNHPLIPEEADQELARTTCYFSARDLAFFAYYSQILAEAVVSATGTTFIIRTAESNELIQRDRDGLTGFSARHPNHSLVSSLLEEEAEREPHDSDEERKLFNLEFAKRYKMRLLFIPLDSNEFKILV